MESKMLSDTGTLNGLQKLEPANENGENMYQTPNTKSSKEVENIERLGMVKLEVSEANEDFIGNGENMVQTHNTKSTKEVKDIERLGMVKLEVSEATEGFNGNGENMVQTHNIESSKEVEDIERVGMVKLEMSEATEDLNENGENKVQTQNTESSKEGEGSEALGMEKLDMSEAREGFKENGENMVQTHSTESSEEGEYIEALGMEKLDRFEAIEDFNENTLASLSLNVNQAELDMFNDYSGDEEELDNKSDKTCDIEAPSVKEAKNEPKSRLHCAICHNYFNCPKLLECFHTFCQSCLMQRVKSNYKYVFCPLCKYRSDIPKGGVEELVDNVVAASLISAKSEEQELSECMICKLHNEVKASTGQCIDCGDTMCEDCCEKHTFSRLTAKHKVVPLAEVRNEEYAKQKQRTKIINCMKHSDEVAEYFCVNCCIPVCSDCTLSGHRLHQCEFLNEAVAGKKELIREKLDSLRQECDVKLVDDAKESEILISEYEKNEFQKLKAVKDTMISIIEQKYNKCAEKLQTEFNIKRRKYCKHKATFIRELRKNVDYLADGIDFMLKEGTDVENAMLESFIMNGLEQKKMRLSNLHPKLTRQSHFPTIHVHREHTRLLEGLTFFNTQLEIRDQNRKDREEKIAKNPMHIENAEVRMKIGRNFQTASNDVQAPVFDTQSKTVTKMSLMMSGVRTQTSGNFNTGLNAMSQAATDVDPPLMSMNLSNVRAPIGRGRMFQSERPSLLGEYPGKNMFELHDSVGGEISSQSKGRSGNKRNRSQKKKHNGVSRDQTFRLNLQTSLNITVMMDQRIPDVFDLVFISTQCFAVSDARNQRLKIFNLCGKFMKYIDDPGPMSVTFCANHLIWSSQFSSIKMYDIEDQKIVRIVRVPQTAAHPLTSFSNVKYLIGNMDQSKVEACTIDGTRVHEIQPQDRNGVPLPDVTHIAARSSDQLISVDRQLKKVVVNDFDGKFIGEYGHDGFEPGGACITEHDNIFVTDKNRNKLILLSAKAKYIREWNTLIDTPSCVASNGSGNIIVAGNGKTVSLYQYNTYN